MNATGSGAVVYFDGTSNRRHAATLAFTDALEIAVDGETKARWAYADIRRADSAPGTLRVFCQSAPPRRRLGEAGQDRVRREAVRQQSRRPGRLRKTRHDVAQRRRPRHLPAV